MRMEIHASSHMCKPPTPSQHTSTVTVSLTVTHHLYETAESFGVLQKAWTFTVCRCKLKHTPLVIFAHVVV